jgi:uncharacterized protein YbbC (DUF1343 family)
VKRFFIGLSGFLCCALLQAASRVQLGNETLAASHFSAISAKRIGLITGPSGVTGNLQSTVDFLHSAPGVKLVALFGAEHGIYGDVSAGDSVSNRTDSRTGLPVYSLYGDTRKPTPDMLRGLDALVYDLQDTGCRSYTFISTMGEAMDACGKAGIEFIVLDRPNPLGGERIEGPMVKDRFRSFVGRWNVPYVYGLTCGELARMINGEHWIEHPCRLTVVPMKHWTRSMVWDETGLPWVPTSPHVPHGDSPMFQVATGMLGEIGGVSSGVGYTLPFECIAAPSLDRYRLADYLNRQRLPGVRFKPTTYKPYYFAFKDQELAGVQIFITDRHTAPLTAINLYALEALKSVGKHDLFAEALAANKNFSMFDKVNGSDETREAFQHGRGAAEIVASWKPANDLFRKQRMRYLLYR